MWVKEHGQGNRIFVAFHGWGGTHREFAPLATRLPEGCRLLSFDLPGYGASPKPDVWDLDAVAAEIERELERRLGEQPRTLIGFCSGNLFSLLLARRKPETVRRIVMIDPFASVPWYFRIFLAGEFGRLAYGTTFQSRLGRAITDWVIKGRQKQDADFTGAFRDIDHDVTRKYLELLNQVDAQGFSDLQVAIDLLYGENTFAEVRKSVRQFRQLWPHAREIVLHDVGHLPMLKGFRQLASAIFDRENGRP
jgi:pimeloyl-ACP methyl ester carboxylesterase